MKKMIKSLLICLIGVGLSSTIVDVNAEELSNVEELNNLVRDYYNNGFYKKHTQIYLSDLAKEEIQSYDDLFHAQTTYLERTTYYNGDELWMSRGQEVDGVKFSYYGTAYEGETPVGVTNGTADYKFVKPNETQVVLSGDNKNSMEEYYVTMNDIVADVEEQWEVNEGIYSSKDVDVIDNFRQFTAPCFLEITEQNKNYIMFSKVSIKEEGNTLILSLFVNPSNSGLVTSSQESDGTYLFSQAIVSKTIEQNWNNYNTEISTNSPNRYQVLSHAADNGLYIYIEQYVDNYVIKDDPSDWNSTHVEMELWNGDIGYGWGGTYFAFFANGTYYINSWNNCSAIYNYVEIKENDNSANYKYTISYNIFIEFPNNLAAPQDGPYAYCKFMFMTPNETNEGYENVTTITKDGNRTLWTDKCNSYEIRRNGIVRKDGEWE